MKEHNEKKAKILYDYLDQSKMFKGTVVPKDRSLMNVPFVIGDKDLEAKFVKEADAAGFVNLKGHRTVGGMRASIYNAMPIEGVGKLVAFMKDFEEWIKTQVMINEMALTESKKVYEEDQDERAKEAMIRYESPLGCLSIPSREVCQLPRRERLP